MMSSAGNRAPKVSVIVTTYNQEDTIGAALDSVIEQVCPFDYEIIIGEDASTDGTREICRRYAERYPGLIRLMPEAPNKGLVDNFFDCMEQARGEYVTDCAGDDTWTSREKLARMAAILDANPGVNVVFSDWTIRDSDTGRTVAASTLPNNLLGSHQVVPGQLILEKTLDHVDSLPYNLSASMYRLRDVADALAANERMVRNKEFGCEDVPLIAALASRGDGLFCPGSTLCYNVHSNSVTNTPDVAKLVRFHSRSLHASAVLSRFYGFGEELLRRVFSSKSDYIVSHAFNSGDPRLRDEVVDTLAEWSLSLSLKSTLQLRLMSRASAWKCGNKIKNLLTRLLGRR